MSGQLIVPRWYAPGALPVLLALASPLALLGRRDAAAGYRREDAGGSGVMLLVVALVHGVGRLPLYGRAAAADADLDRADQAASEQYAVLCRNIERREHERLLHDTVLNTLTALARAARDAVAEVVSQVPAGRGPDRGRAQRPDDAAAARRHRPATCAARCAPSSPTCAPGG